MNGLRLDKAWLGPVSHRGLSEQAQQRQGSNPCAFLISTSRETSKGMWASELPWVRISGWSYSWHFCLRPKKSLPALQLWTNRTGFAALKAGICRGLGLSVFSERPSKSGPSWAALNSILYSGPKIHMEGALVSILLVSGARTVPPLCVSRRLWIG